MEKQNYTEKQIGLSKSEKKNQNNSSSSEREETVISVEGTPFNIVKINDRWSISIGYQIAETRGFDSIEEAKEELSKTNWEIMGTFVQMMLMNRVEDVIKGGE